MVKVVKSIQNGDCSIHFSRVPLYFHLTRRPRHPTQQNPQNKDIHVTTTEDEKLHGDHPILPSASRRRRPKQRQLFTPNLVDRKLLYQQFHPTFFVDLRAMLCVTVAIYILNQKHVLPRRLSAIVSKTLFWATLPISQHQEAWKIG